MDVHAPHEPIHGWKDFLLHLLTITVGLLIAVGIEGCVELHREHKLVKEARETLRAEIEYNARQATDAVTSLDKERAAIANNIKVLTRIKEDPKDREAQNASITADFSNVTLRDTAWKTAEATGALAFMPYVEAQKYADLYGAQKDFLAQQDKIVEDEAQFLGVMAKTNFGHGDVTPDQASAALERFGIWQGHLLYLDLTAKVAAMSDKAFLEGKEPPRSLHEDLNQK